MNSGFPACTRRAFLASAATLAAGAPIVAPPVDLCIYGGSSAGVAAAVQASRMGLNTLLIEPGRHLGGMSVEGLGSSDINNHWFRNSTAIGGIAAEFYQRLASAYGQQAPQYLFEPHVAEKVFEDWIREAKAHVLRGVWAVSARKHRARLQSITLNTGATINARVFLDATYEGDLLPLAGIATFSGREPNSRYNETRNGIRAENTYRNFTVRVDPYVIPGKASSGVIPTIQDEPLGTPGDGDHRIQGYCFRMCLTRQPANRVRFTKPDNYDPRQYEIYRRYVQAGGQLFTPQGRLPNGKTDQGSWHDLSANLYGMNHAYPTGDRQTRERIYRQHLDFTRGLTWFLSNDPSLPEPLRATWHEWGVCQDEFQDNYGWPRQFYVREARRLISDYVITEHTTLRINQEQVGDPVVVSYWPPDTHHVRRIIRDGAAYNEGFVFGGDNWGPFGISYRALLPRQAECENLITPTCLSSTHIGYGALRLEWTFLALGQAAATAAALAIQANQSLQQVAYNKLRSRLIQDQQILTVAPPEPK